MVQVEAPGDEKTTMLIVHIVCVYIYICRVHIVFIVCIVFEVSQLAQCLLYC